MLTINDTSQDVTPQVPLCVYCDRPMRPLVADRLRHSDELTLFCCQDCGWEVAVPLR